MNRLPNREKERRGTLIKSRIPKMNIESMKEVPDPIQELNDLDKEFYYTVCSIFIEWRVLSAAFLNDIERAAVWNGLFWRAKTEVEKNGGVQVTKTGYSQKSGYASMMAEAEKHLQHFKSKYGLNASDMEKVPRIDDSFNDPDSLFD